MNNPEKKPKTIPEYINSAPKEVQEMLRDLYTILKEVAPTAKESIKWGYPVFEEKRILFSFSAHKNHINFMPTGPAIKPFEKELENYTTGKDTIQLPYTKPLPKELIKKIASFRVEDVKNNNALWMYK